jgi:hypothetical protein
MNLRPALLLALLVVGCDDGPGAGTVPKAPPRPAAANPPAQVAREKPQEKAKAKPILGERTQDVKDAQAELKKGSAVAAPRVISKDPITLSGNTYVYAIGKTAIDNIKHAVDLYQATNGEYPKTHEEFMEKIIKENNISLPVLPYYQSYSYDKDKHMLIILEYPDKKAAGPGR